MSGWLSRGLGAQGDNTMSSDRFIVCLNILCEREALQPIKTAGVRRPLSLPLPPLRPESGKMTQERSLDEEEHMIDKQALESRLLVKRLTARNEQRGNECELHF